MDLAKIVEKYCAQQQFSQAISHLENHLLDHESPQAYLYLGRVHSLANQNDKAEESYLKGIQSDPQFTPFYHDMLNLMIMNGNTQKALEWGYLALKAEPKHEQSLQSVIALLSPLQLNLYSAPVEDMVHICLKAAETDPAPLAQIWLNILKLHPQFGAFYKSLSLKNYSGFLKSLPPEKPLNLAFFIDGLQRLVVPDQSFEKFLTYLRRWLLEYTDNDLPLDGDTDYARLIAALGCYVHQTEYIFALDQDEQEDVEAIRDDINYYNPPRLADILLYALYEPLTSLTNIEEIKTVLGDEGLLDFLRIHITDYETRLDIKKTIQSLTPIENDVSEAVREQYETFPYPRWGKVGENVNSAGHVSFLGEERTKAISKAGAKILIAGCGTGQQACEYAIAFPNASILAVDLSQTSLSYAISKKKEHGLNNIEFRQGDILQLGEHLKPEYDMIISTGVLHHMKDPELGWSVLNGLLKSGGIMRIALYSEIARTSLVRAQEIIRKKRFGHDAQGIRDFRSNIDALLKKDDAKLITSTSDYYKMSECRDALFHVQEHLFSVPRIQAALDKMGLEFYRFENIPPNLTEQYKRAFPDNPEMDNLDYWHKFEQKNRLAFLQMYRFFCFKP